MNKYCMRGVRPDLIFRNLIDSDYKCDRFSRLSRTHMRWLYWDEETCAFIVNGVSLGSIPGRGLKGLSDRFEGKCQICTHNRKLRSKGLP